MSRKAQLNMPIRVPLLLLTLFPLFFSQVPSAKASPSPVWCESAPEPKLFEQKANSDKVGAIGDDTISAKEPTAPSFWWAKQQFDPFEGKLVTNWQANPNAGRIDLVVNRQLWSSLNYLDRYRFVNNFGTVARDYQYELRVFNERQKCLAVYTCNFGISPHQCEMNLDPSVGNGLKRN